MQSTRRAFRHGTRGRSWRVLAAIVAGWSLAGVSCDGDIAPAEEGSGSAGAARPNILVLTLDTTRADALAMGGAETPRAPRLDALAQESLRLTLARSPSPLTLPSHCSMFTGLYPFAHGVRDNDAYRLHEEAHTLAFELAEAGYRTEAVVAASVLGAQTGLGRGFERYDDVPLRRARHAAVEAERSAPEITGRALKRLTVDDSRPWMLWVHYFDPHWPYEPPDWTGEPGGEAAYWAEITAMDAEIGRLLDAVDAAGPTAILVIADHGEGLRSVQEDSHGFLCEEPTLRVPMLLRVPGATRRGELPVPTSSVDVFTTLLGVAGLETPYPVHGVDLLTAEPDPERVVYFETLRTQHVMGWAPMFGVAGTRWKFVEQAVEELFDLDIGERRRVDGEQPEVMARMRGALQALRDDDITRFESEAAVTTPAEAARLMQLGYLARSISETDARTERPNPRQHYRAFVAYQSALGYAGRGEFRRAMELLEQVVSRYPDNPSFHWRLGETYDRLGRPDDAEQSFRAALDLDARNLGAQFGLGRVFERSQRLDDAARAYARVLSWFPEHFDAAEGLWRVTPQGTDAKLEAGLRLLTACDRLEVGSASTERALVVQDLQALLGGDGDSGVAQRRRALLRAAFDGMPEESRATLRPWLDGGAALDD